MQIQASTLFSVLIALIGVWGTFIKIERDNKKDREDRDRYRDESVRKSTERHTELSIKLDSLMQSNQNIANEMKSLDKKVDELDRRVTITEESTKSAHKRIDEANQKCESRSHP